MSGFAMAILKPNFFPANDAVKEPDFGVMTHLGA
jgi:hypothetical protein